QPWRPDWGKKWWNWRPQGGKEWGNLFLEKPLRELKGGEVPWNGNCPAFYAGVAGADCSTRAGLRFWSKQGTIPINRHATVVIPPTCMMRKACGPYLPAVSSYMKQKSNNCSIGDPIFPSLASTKERRIVCGSYSIPYR